MNRATGSAASRWVNNSSLPRDIDTSLSKEPKTMSFVLLPVTSHQKIFDCLSIEAAGAPFRSPHIDLGEIEGQSLAWSEVFK
ncbi:hypothetical protein NUU61_001360 [Penicillium alfredii]|uniref:Uncharacterized protein n=1 Tax=Penicillium alfredii TaxID=1506179 RepID=A0A9W9G3Y1_9EURO|nr:uncharacterized protein NUU61_001360 [Penicillium alfredii]KAJ5111730.1 hypothetical protein NUU61_001360 [Penicillium alfredii]